MEKEMIVALTRNLATRELPDDAIPTIAKFASVAKRKPYGVSVCETGICFDFFIEGGLERLQLDELITELPGRLADIEIFPYGIVRPDLMHVRVAQQF